MYFAKIYNLIKNNTIIQRSLLVIMIVVLSFFLIRECTVSKKNSDIAEWNMKVLKTETKEVYTKNKQIEFEKNALSVTVNSLRLYNDSLYKELEKERGDVKAIYKIDLIYKIDTVYVNKSTYTKKDSSYTIYWNFDINENSISSILKGNTMFVLDTTNNSYTLKNIYSSLLDYKLSLNLVTGIKEVGDDKYSIFVRTKENNKNITFNLDGAVIDNKFSTKRNWFVVGPFVGATYTNQIEFTYGIGITIKLFEF